MTIFNCYVSSPEGIQLFGDDYDEFGMKAIDFWAFWDEQQGWTMHTGGPETSRNLAGHETNGIRFLEWFLSFLCDWPKQTNRSNNCGIVRAKIMVHHASSWQNKLPSGKLT